MTANKEKELWKSKINRKTQLALLAEFYSKEGNMNTNLASFIVGLIIDENDRFTLCKRMVKPMLLLRKKANIQ